MSFILIGLLILAAVYGPQLWARHVLSKHSKPRDDLADTGGEFARRLLRDIELSGVAVEPTEIGDHYDPIKKAVRLTPRHMEKKSLAAVVVAAHEVGHAIQDAGGYPPFHARTALVLKAQWIQKAGPVLMMAIPLVAVLARSPRLGLLMFVAGLATLGSSLFVHLVTLPVEWDASFRRALPVLSWKRYIDRKDMLAAREILTACALTYVASSLASLLNVWRWIAILRR